MRGSLVSSNLHSMGRKLLDIVGQTFNHLTVIKFTGITKRLSHFECLCSCGKRVTVGGPRLTSGHTKSCGHIKNVSAKHHLPHGVASMRKVIGTYKYNAKNKGQEFSISDQEMEALFQSDCAYCGRPPSAVARNKRSFGEYTYTGIDRLDNTKGYIQGNVAPCCSECNYKKGEQEWSDFIQWASRVAAYSVTSPTLPWPAKTTSTI